MKRAIFLAIALIRFGFSYEFTDRFPEDDNLFVDVVFSYPDRDIHAMQEIVVADVMYILATKSLQRNSQIVAQPFIYWVAKTKHVNDPYQFRLLKIARTDQGSIRKFWTKLKELSTQGINREDLEMAKKSLFGLLEKLKQQSVQLKQFFDKYKAALKELDPQTFDQYAKTGLTVKEAKIDYAISPISLAYVQSNVQTRLVLVTHNPNFQIELSEEDKANIYEIIHTMGTHGLFSLLKKKSHLQSLGKKIAHVAPLQLLAYVFTDHTLRNDMKAVYSNNFKWSNFIDGLSKTLKRDWRTGIVRPQLPGFAQLVGKDSMILEKYLERNEIEEFVKELL